MQACSKAAVGGRVGGWARQAASRWMGGRALGVSLLRPGGVACGSAASPSTPDRRASFACLSKGCTPGACRPPLPAPAERRRRWRRASAGVGGCSARASLCFMTRCPKINSRERGACTELEGIGEPWSTGAARHAGDSALPEAPSNLARWVRLSISLGVRLVKSLSRPLRSDRPLRMLFPHSAQTAHSPPKPFAPALDSPCPA